jgi:hypothetical protein
MWKKARRAVIVLLLLALVLAWFLVCARLMRREEIDNAKHGPELEVMDRRAAYRAALLELHDRVSAERESLRRRGLLQ